MEEFGEDADDFESCEEKVNKTEAEARHDRSAANTNGVLPCLFAVLTLLGVDARFVVDGSVWSSDSR